MKKKTHAFCSCRSLYFICDDRKCKKCLEYYCYNCMVGSFCRPCHDFLEKSIGVDSWDYEKLQDLVLKYGKDHMQQVLANL